MRIRNFLNPLSRAEIFEYVWIRNRVDAKSLFFFNPVTSQDSAQFFTANIEDGAERNVIAFLRLGLQFQVL